MATDNVHLAGVKALHITNATNLATLKTDTDDTYKVKNPAGDTFTVNPSAPAFNEKFRENQAYPAIVLKDPKSGRVESLAWEILDWDDTTVELYLGSGAGTGTDVWMAPTDSYCAEKSVRVDFVTGWSWIIPKMIIAAAPGGDASANGNVTIQAVGKIVSDGTNPPLQRIKTPVAAE
jgi:hypothetical protein